MGLVLTAILIGLFYRRDLVAISTSRSVFPFLTLIR